MPVEKVEQLEELVSYTLQCLENFYSENCQLELRVQELEKEKEILLKEYEREKYSLEKLKELEVSHRKLQKNCCTARTKIKNILQKIEKMDFV
jgi:hypothetical protein